MTRSLALLALVLTSPLALAADPIDLGGVREEHVMIPMRDGVKLSAFLFFPPGDGPWPVLLEQRYANGSDPGTKKSFAKLARGGYVTVLANFRGSQESEGTWSNGSRNKSGPRAKSGRSAVRRPGSRRIFSPSRSRRASRRNT
jgi:hypothetical protein